MQLLGSQCFNLIFVPRRVLCWMRVGDIQHLTREFAGTHLQHHRNNLTFGAPLRADTLSFYCSFFFINTRMLLMWMEFHISNCEGLVRSRLVRDFRETDSLSQLPLPTWSSNDLVKQIFSIMFHHHQDHVVRGKEQTVEELSCALQIFGSTGTQRQR